MKNSPSSLPPFPLSLLGIKAHPPDISPISEVYVRQLLHSTYSIIISKNLGAALARSSLSSERSHGERPRPQLYVQRWHGERLRPQI
ncbi:hypothetical protein Y032_0261g556 [Ancylostoma ceylanicum]|uniref:Uncharacterized protein n=1 Tax=Ancylostoma ceylanicum TaxID=53326 RepID=A0A016SA78_9BILA|nr:hypothetical protein Y032_0261g556 [Ancylostoma ceylanicum]